MFFYLLLSLRAIECRLSESKSQIDALASGFRRGWNSYAPLWYWIEPDFDTALTYPAMNGRSRPAAGTFIYTCPAVQQERNAKQASRDEARV
jgi:hypothetical protein